MNKNQLKSLVPVAVAMIISVIVYVPSLGNRFTNWDDPAFITENPDIQGLSCKNMGKFFTHSYGGFGGYVPFVLLSYALEYELSGLDPGTFHAVNLVLHLINCALVYWFIFLVSRQRWTAFFVALLFGIHPLHVEAVAWIQGRKDLLFSLFYLAALISYFKYREKGEKKIFYYGTLIFFIFSLFSKVAAISLPFALLLLDYFISKSQIRISIRKMLPFFSAAFLFLVFAFLTSVAGSFVIQETHNGYLDNILVFFFSFVFYIGKIFLPVRLSARYPMEIFELMPTFLLFVVLVIFAAVIILLYRLYRIRKYEVTFGILFFLVTLMPTIPFHFIGQPYADRYLYLPVIGIFYLGALFFHNLYIKKSRIWKKGKVLLWIGFILLTFTLGAATWRQCKVWKDSLTLWNDVLESYPTLPLAYLDRGEVYLRMGEMEKALQDLNKSVLLAPGNAHAYNDRGIIYFHR
ncbi:MAG TPA: tetratricopeptide repeat protein, partial [Candidatus Kapabacteria bacterium]|nr:tetratricopeptide repeat protein [Candidatus Kapabacteria bacterium]